MVLFIFNVTTRPVVCRLPLFPLLSPPPFSPLLVAAQELAMVNGLADCYDQGLIRAAGVSNYGAKQLAVVQKQLERRGVPLASAQVRGG